MRHLTTLTALVATAAFAGPASAAYAPKFSVQIDPATPSAAAAITTTITQAVMETPNKKVVVSFPVGFSANLLARPVICPQSDVDRRQCAPDTQIGVASATASVGVLPVDLPGTVHYGGADANGIRLIVFLRSQLAGDQTIVGNVKFGREDGGFDVVFDNLPDTLTTKFTLALQGGDKALSLTPDTCGQFVFKAGFTSQKGEQASSDAPVTVKDCVPEKLSLLNLALARTGTVTFNLTTAATGTATIRRGTKRIASKSFTGRGGVTRVKTRKLAKGRYRVAVLARTTDGQVVTKARTINVR